MNYHSFLLNPKCNTSRQYELAWAGLLSSKNAGEAMLDVLAK